MLRWKTAQETCFESTSKEKRYEGHKVESFFFFLFLLTTCTQHWCRSSQWAHAIAVAITWDQLSQELDNNFKGVVSKPVDSNLSRWSIGLWYNREVLACYWSRTLHAGLLLSVFSGCVFTQVNDVSTSPACKKVAHLSKSKIVLFKYASGEIQSHKQYFKVIQTVLYKLILTFSIILLKWIHS